MTALVSEDSATVLALILIGIRSVVFGFPRDARNDGSTPNKLSKAKPNLVVILLGWRAIFIKVADDVESQTHHVDSRTFGLNVPSTDSEFEALFR